MSSEEPPKDNLADEVDPDIERFDYEGGGQTRYSSAVRRVLAAEVEAIPPADPTELAIEDMYSEGAPIRPEPENYFRAA